MFIRDSRGFHIRIIQLRNGKVFSAIYIINKQKVPEKELKYINETYKDLLLA